MPRGKTSMDFNKKKNLINGWADERIFDNEDDIQKKLNATQKMPQRSQNYSQKFHNNGSYKQMTNS